MASRKVRRQKQKLSIENVAAAEKKRKNNPFLWIFSVAILIVIVVTFIGGPIVGSMGKRDRLIFGIYNNKYIEYIPGNYLSQQKNIIAEQIRDAGNSDDFQWQLYQTWKGAFDRTVIHTAILDEAYRSGLYVTETRIDTEIVNNGPYILKMGHSTSNYTWKRQIKKKAIQRIL